jgi:N-acetyl sugar amidotransferase
MNTKNTNNIENENLEVKYGLPSEVHFCKECIISNQRPSSVIEFKNKSTDSKPTISFDADGVCSACKYAKTKEKIDWLQREKELIELCDLHRSKDGSYDCIIPGSGGKDSAFTSHILKYKYGMNPLTVTWSPHVYTEIGWENFENWIDSGVDNVLFSPNGKLHRLLTRLAFENLVHPFQPFIIGQKLIGPRMSALYGIPLVFYGENQAEYGNNIKDNETPTMDMSFFYEDKSNVNEIFLGGVSVSDLIEHHGVNRNDLNPYLPVDSEKLISVGTEVHYLGYYLKWDPQECFYYAMENTGFKINPERTEGTYSKYSSIDDRIDPLHYFTTLIKFGIGRATYDAAQEVRNGKITREEAIALIKRYDCEFPAKYFNEILNYMGITEERFWEVINAARSPHLWKFESNEWTLREPIWEK